LSSIAPSGKPILSGVFGKEGKRTENFEGKKGYGIAKLMQIASIAQQTKGSWARTTNEHISTKLVDLGIPRVSNRRALTPGKRGKKPLLTSWGSSARRRLSCSEGERYLRGREKSHRRPVREKRERCQAESKNQGEKGSRDQVGKRLNPRKLLERVLKDVQLLITMEANDRANRDKRASLRGEAGPKGKRRGRWGPPQKKHRTVSLRAKAGRLGNEAKERDNNQQRRRGRICCLVAQH